MGIKLSKSSNSSKSLPTLPTNRNSSNELKKEDLNYLVEYFNDLKNQEKVKKIFDFYDKDHSGYIDQHEFKDFLEEVKIISKDNPIVKRFLENYHTLALMDQNDDGKISFEEFLDSARHTHPYRVAILGTQGSGKTTLINQFLHRYKMIDEYEISLKWKTYLYSALLKDFKTIGRKCLEKNNFDTEEMKSRYENIVNFESNSFLKLGDDFAKVYNDFQDLWSDTSFQAEYQKNYENIDLFESLD